MYLLGLALHAIRSREAEPRVIEAVERAGTGISPRRAGRSRLAGAGPAGAPGSEAANLPFWLRTACGRADARQFGIHASSSPSFGFELLSFGDRLRSPRKGL